MDGGGPVDYGRWRWSVGLWMVVVRWIMDGDGGPVDYGWIDGGSFSGLWMEV